MPETAPQEETYEIPEEEDYKTEHPIASSEKDHLSKNELKDVKNEKTSIQKLAREREELKQNKKDNEKLNESDNEKLDENDPHLKTFREQFNKICDDNTDLIGTKEVPGYKKWFEQELRKNPTIAFAKETIKKLEGKNTHTYDKNGLAPRREIYKELTGIFKKYKLGTPQKSEYIKREGLSERKSFLKEIKSAETEINKVNDSFWSHKAKEKTMQEILIAKNPNEQKTLTKQINKINQIESEGFIYMKNTMSIGGTTVRKMSDASINAFLQGLTNEGNIQKRLEYITGNGKYSNGIKEAVQNEASLYGKKLKPEVASLFGVTKGLEEIYKNHPDKLKLAIQSFEKLDFIKKIQALKDHEKLVEKSGSKEDLEKKLTVKASEVAIDEAARKREVSGPTQKKYKEWFRDENNYKDPKTDKPGNLEVLKKFYEILTSATPDGKARNLSAYKTKRNRFKLEIKELQNINPDIDESELKKWQDKYDKEGWTDRKKIYKNIKKEQEKLDREQEKKKEIEKTAGLTKENKEKGHNLNKKETIQSSIALINEDQPAEALKKLIEYNDANPDDQDIIFWMEVALKRIKEFGSGKKQEKETDKQVEKEVKSVTETDEKIKDRIEEENLTTLNLEGAQMSEEKHGRKISGQDRAEEESIDRTQSGSLEKDLTKDFYKQTDKKHILNEEGTGEEITEIKFDDTDMTGRERQSLKEKTRQKEGRLINKKGFTHIEKKDKSGKKISSEQAQGKQKERLERLEDDIAKKALKKAEKKEGKEDKSIYDLNTRVAAKRKSKEIVEKERHSHDRLRR